MNDSLYDRIGGEPAIMAAVGLLYERLLADDLTRPFFEGMEITAQVKKQVAFMTHAFDGPAEYRGRDLREAHQHLVANSGLGDAHFDAIKAHLAACLRELQLAEPTIAEVLQIVERTRAAVLDR